MVRDEFKKLGCDAWSCDLLPSDVPGQHLQCNVLNVLDKGWDIGIFHPDCTYLCASGMHWTTRGLRDPQLTVDAIRFAEALWDSPIKHVAIENPTGALSTKSKLGKYSCRVQPYEFGDDASKGTCLWLRGLPTLEKHEDQYVKPRMVCKCGQCYTYQELSCPKCGASYKFAKPRWSNQTDSGQNKLGPSEDRWKHRSKTYQGIAFAMASQWKRYVIDTSTAYP